MKKVLITGASGFVGLHLIAHLLKENNLQIFATYLNEFSEQEKLKNLVKFIKIDLNRESEIENLIKSSEPDYVYHLAALSSASSSFDNPKETLINNILVEVNLLEAIRRNGLKPKILIVSSAEVYGHVDPKDLPIDEETELRPTSPYAVSKIAQDFLGLQYYLSYDIGSIRVRPFNHIGPGQSPNFVVPAFCKKIVEIEKGKREKVLTVGNLESRRDFTDVRDVVKAYALLMGRGKEGDVYNIGSGKSHKISDILDSLLSLTDEKIKIVQDQSLLRASDDPDLVCDFTKIKEKTGWSPTIPLTQTLKDTLDYWRNII